MADFHPMTVHFPVVLLVIWPILDGLGLVLNKPDLCRTAIGMLAVTLVAALFATLTGQAAFDEALAAGYDAKLLEQHTLDADLVPWLVLVLLLIRIPGVQKMGKKGHLLSIALGFALSGFLLMVAHRGGELVYDYGVGVKQIEVNK